MPVPVRIVDAFTSEPFAGNPAGVCLPAAPLDAAHMQRIAAELNLAATAFAWPQGEGFALRWFTPVRELELCGHGTLAAAHSLWEAGVRGGELCFATRSGELRCAREGGVVRMDFPAEPAAPCAAPPELAELCSRATFVGRNRLDVLVVLTEAAAVRELRVDPEAVARVETRGLIVTARSPGQQEPGSPDFVSRFFAPRMGLPEDAVTGSAHCCLGPYWSAVLGRARLVGYQASPRGGFVDVETRGERVWIRGRAVTTVVGAMPVG